MYWGNASPSSIPKCCFFNLELCLIFSFPLSHRITHLRGVKTLTHSDFPRSCGTSIKCHNANKITRGSRTHKQWRSLKLPFPGMLYSFSIQSMNWGYCRSFWISLLIRVAVLYRGAMGEWCSLDVFPALRFTVVLQCCTCFKFRFLRPHA